METYAWMIVAGAWVAFSAVWFFGALGAKRTLARGGAWVAYRLAFAAVIVVLFSVPAFHSFVAPYARSTANPLISGVGAVLAVLGVAFSIWARIHLGRNWGMPMSVKERPELVTTGPYAFVRNPIYSGMLVAFVGSGLVAGAFWFFVLVAFGPYFIYSALQEEKLMRATFPDTYPAYAARTKRLVPFVW